MFFRIALPGARRILADHIAFCNQHVPKWNPMSVVGQHMQQAGANPAEAVAFTLSTAIQNAQDCIARGMDPDDFLPRFTFFFDISISFFEEIAKFRAARRIWARITRDRLGAKDPRSWRFKFHGQTSGVDLTRQQPLNNISRVTVQAMAGILGGLQSLHTDAYDEALSVPSADGARIAVATQNILREEAHLTDVIDPLGGSFYIEKLTDDMEAEIERVMKIVEDAGGMYKAVESRPGAAHDRRLGAQVPAAHRCGRADRRRRQRLPGRGGQQRTADQSAAGPRGDAGAHRCLQGVQGAALAGRGARRARRPGARRRRSRRQRVRPRGRGGRSRLHARRDLPHAAARDGLRPRAGDRVKRDPLVQEPGWVQDVLAGQRGAIARVLSQVERGEREPATVAAALAPHLGRAHVLGITARPAPASRRWCTPCSAKCWRAASASPWWRWIRPARSRGGAVLGDRVRMGEHGAHADVFIRSVASRGHLGGLSRTTAAMIDVLDAAGFDTVIVETVGAGQSEVEIMRVADTRLVACPPGLGDNVQALKAGILEIADVLVVTKSDLPGGEATARDLKDMLHLRAAGAAAEAGWCR